MHIPTPESSMISAIGTVGDKLLVVFRNGPVCVYTYNGVPKRTITNLLKAKSKGKYFNQHIRGRYPFTKE